jgi:spermidine/putrescine transport system ATP-binding protein
VPQEGVIVAVEDVRRSFGAVEALRGVSFTASRGEFVSILGPSGCGKTTLLRIIAGFELPDSGSVSVQGRDVTAVPPHARPVNMVFQRYALFPHMTVGQNIGYGPKIRRRGRRDIAQRVEELLRLVHLEGYGNRSITQLSGGQAQRVALARALANEPPVLVLDEPLAALDRKLRQSMHLELRHIQQSLGSTFIYVTHDQEEALTMSDRIILMNEGLIEQVGSPVDLYMAPRSRFVSSFVGDTNLFEGEVSSSVQSAEGSWELLLRLADESIVKTHYGQDLERGRKVWLSVRPEALSLRESANAPGRNGTNELRGTVSERIFLGSTIRYVVTDESGTQFTTDVASLDATPLDPGDAVTVEWPPSAGTVLCA